MGQQQSIFNERLPDEWPVTPRNREAWRRMKINTIFVECEERRCGELQCFWCGKRPLLIYHWSSRDAPRFQDMATADHITPRSLLHNARPDLTDNWPNLEVSCYRCNQERGDWLHEDDSVLTRHIGHLEARQMYRDHPRSGPTATPIPPAVLLGAACIALLGAIINERTLGAM